MSEDLFLCPDCEQPLATSPDSNCPACQQWRDERFAQMTSDHRGYEARRARMRMSPGARFGEELADMVKVMERGKQ